ncbi:hypothetical protein ACIQ4I_15700 [Rummeliibacillus sp. NPDC094406]|uniref:hypothetical protein n=1 Tax=Rummeliibacillus sp. NPDC094406 TaxID=3364511 RepID=UPI0037F9CE1E
MSKEIVEYTVGELKLMSRKHFVNELGAYTTCLDLKYRTSQEKSWWDCYYYLINEFEYNIYLRPLHSSI